MRKWIITFLFLYFFIPLAFSQLPVDSSRQNPFTPLWQMVDQDSSVVKALIRKGRSYLQTYNVALMHPDSAKLYLQQAVKLADALHMNSLKHFAMGHLGDAYNAAGDEKTRAAIFEQVIGFYHQSNNKAQEARYALWYGNNYYGGAEGIDHRLARLLYARSLYQEFDDLKGISDADVMISYYYFQNAQMDSAEYYGLECLAGYKRLKNPRIYGVYATLATLSRYNGDLTRALGYAINCVNTKELAHDSIPADRYMGELAQIYQELGQPELSVPWYRKTIALRERLGFAQFSIYWTQGLMGKELVKLGQGDTALLEMQQLVRRNPPKDTLCRAVMAQNLAYAYNAVHQYAKADHYYTEMIRWYDLYSAAEDIKNPGFFNSIEYISIAEQDVGAFYVQQKRYAAARPHLEKAWKLCFPFSVLPRQIDLQLMMYTADSATGDYVAAIQHFRQYQQLHDSVFNVTKSQQIAAMEVQFQTREKEKDIELLHKESLLQQNRLRQAGFLRNIILAGIVVLLVMIALLYNRYRFKQRANSLLESQQYDLRMLVKEKEWLVKEIHHRVKNNLHIVSGLLDNQAAFLKTEEAVEAIRNSQHRVFAMSLIHQKLYQSDNLSVTEMPAYVQEIVAYLETAFGVRNRIRFCLEIVRVELALSYVVPLGLILNEAITNALKYAFPDERTGRILVRLEVVSTDVFRLTIADDGIGLPPDFEPHKYDSMGLSLMQGLSEEIQGHFTICCQQGTQVVIVFKYVPTEKQTLVINPSEFITEITSV